MIYEVTVTVEAPYTEAESRQMAEDFVRDSATFQFDGIEDSLELVETLYPDMEYAWQFVFQFDSRHAGYGDREGQMLAQVITPHEAVIAVERGEVINAVMDEKWHMMEQQMLEPGPSVEIASPQPGASPETNQVTVEIEVSNFSVVDKLGEEPVAGEGHVHFYMDVEIPTSPGEPAVTGEGTYAVSTENSHTWTDVSPGQHTFSVQLVNNNHSPLEPPVVDSVQVTVEEPAVSPPPAGTQVTIRDFSYQPAEVTIEPGETVTWVNEDATTHTVTGGVLDSGDIGAGENYSHTFEEPGTYDYTCEYHPSMQGTVEVEEEDTY
ncbi:MAG: plastocyanin/azurin family copper-binding protein [Chloroflexota bacterium]